MERKKVESDGSFDYLNLEAVINPLNVQGVKSSTKMENWEKISPVKQFPDKITKKVIPIDFAHYRMIIVTKVEPGTLVDTHMHEEPVFRYVIEGEFELNNIKHVAGDWVLVPSHTPYRVTTDTGYIVIAAYGGKCGSPHDLAVKNM